jgi:fucose permease
MTTQFAFGLGAICGVLVGAFLVFYAVWIAIPRLAHRLVESFERVLREQGQ